MGKCNTSQQISYSTKLILLTPSLVNKNVAFLAYPLDASMVPKTLVAIVVNELLWTYHVRVMANNILGLGILWWRPRCFHIVVSDFSVTENAAD